MGTIFRKGDRVFDIEYGWGSVIEVQVLNRYAVKVLFDAKCQHTYLFDGQYPSEGGYPRKVLSFTEYTLEGFSQERPEELPEIGDIVWVRDEFPSEWIIGYFFRKEGNNYFISPHPKPTGFTYSGIEIRTTNPYE
jgi:hypothetical protein